MYAHLLLKRLFLKELTADLKATWPPILFIEFFKDPVLNLKMNNQAEHNFGKFGDPSGLSYIKVI